MVTHVDFLKGHGTENDFVLVPDPDARLGDVLTGPVVRMLTDRYAGIGADGVIRAVRTADVPEVAEQAQDAEWFMDYRNADGSVAEMCGNGVRVLARYLLDHGWADGPTLALATRGGVRTVHAEPDGQLTVDMGEAVPLAEPSGHATVALGERRWEAVAIAVPNPHAVVFLEREADALAELGVLTTMPTVGPEELFPEGANVEFVVGAGPRRIAMRVWERGVGETRSCGTGVCAAAWAAMRRDGVHNSAYTVDVPGGSLRVTEQPDGRLLLTGPAVLGVHGTVAV